MLSRIGAWNSVLEKVANPAPVMGRLGRRATGEKRKEGQDIKVTFTFLQFHLAASANDDDEEEEKGKTTVEKQPRTKGEGREGEGKTVASQSHRQMRRGRRRAGAVFPFFFLPCRSDIGGMEGGGSNSNTYKEKKGENKESNGRDCDSPWVGECGE